MKDNHTNYLVIEYKGTEYERFFSLAKHLFKTLKITNYHIYKGKDVERLQIFIAVDKFSLKKAHDTLEVLSNALSQKMVKKWKCLPSSSLPEDYNIVTLPYKKSKL